jgi:RNA polymerase sigma-70 factor (ECF subfamily)
MESQVIEQTEISLSERTESSLVLDAQWGDRDAFGELARRYERAVYATALRRLGNHAEAQEVCQEVLVRAMQKISQLREPEAFGSWLQSVTNRMAINRAVRKRPVIATDPETIAATCIERETPLSRTLARERQSQVRAGLGRLGALDRDTLVAFYVKGQSLLEMSEGFRSPVGTIKRRLHVARKRLAKELQEFVAV